LLENKPNEKLVLLIKTHKQAVSRMALT